MHVRAYAVCSEESTKSAEVGRENVRAACLRWTQINRFWQNEMESRGQKPTGTPKSWHHVTWRDFLSFSWSRYWHMDRIIQWRWHWANWNICYVLRIQTPAERKNNHHMAGWKIDMRCIPCHGAVWHHVGLEYVQERHCMYQLHTLRPTVVNRQLTDFDSISISSPPTPLPPPKKKPNNPDRFGDPFSFLRLFCGGFFFPFSLA